MLSKSIFVFFLTSLIFTSKLAGCTGILLKAKDGSIVNGRTVEFNMKLDMSVAVIPRNSEFVGKTPNGNGMAYQSKYAAMGIYCFSNQALMDGINEKGLVAAAFYFPGYAKYTPITNANQSKALSPVDFTNWILSQFSTLDEVKAAINSVVIAPTAIDEWGAAPPPMHYIVYDSSGKSIVIEPTDGNLIVYDNPIGVITNSPTFDWHLTNLTNYINLTPYGVKPIQIRSLELSPFGQGSGMQGLPGDFTPPSRFIRATIFSTTALPSENSTQSVNQTFHILNQFDIPLGVSRESNNGQTTYDYTPLTTVKDPTDMKYYYKSYKDQTIRFIDLNQFDLDANTIKHMDIDGVQDSLNMSSSLE